MSPTIVLRDGKPWLTVGTPGGSTIITTVLQLLTDRIDPRMTLPQAIAAPRASQRNTAATQRRGRRSCTTPEAAALRARGHTFATPAEIGAATGIEFLRRRRQRRRPPPSRCAAAAAARWSCARSALPAGRWR